MANTLSFSIARLMDPAQGKGKANKAIDGQIQTQEEEEQKVAPDGPTFLQPFCPAVADGQGAELNVALNVARNLWAAAAGPPLHQATPSPLLNPYWAQFLLRQNQNPVTGGSFQDSKSTPTLPLNYFSQVRQNYEQYLRSFALRGPANQLRMLLPSNLVTRSNDEIDQSSIKSINFNPTLHQPTLTPRKTASTPKIGTSPEKQKSFACHDCGKVFNAHYNLTRHMPVHTGARPFVCKVFYQIVSVYYGIFQVNLRWFSFRCLHMHNNSHSCIQGQVNICSQNDPNQRRALVRPLIGLLSQFFQFN